MLPLMLRAAEMGSVPIVFRISVYEKGDSAVDSGITFGFNGGGCDDGQAGGGG